MDRRLRRDVVERQRPLVLVDRPVRNLAAQDLREHVLVVVGLGGVDRHQASRAAFSASPDVPSRRSSSAMTAESGISFSANRTRRWNKTSAASPTSSSRLLVSAATTASTASSPSLRAITGSPRAHRLAT